MVWLYEKKYTGTYQGLQRCHAFWKPLLKNLQTPLWNPWYTVYFAFFHLSHRCLGYSTKLGPPDALHGIEAQEVILISTSSANEYQKKGDLGTFGKQNIFFFRFCLPILLAWISWETRLVDQVVPLKTFKRTVFLESRGLEKTHEPQRKRRLCFWVCN